jgi:type I restriction enzyme M protein
MVPVAEIGDAKNDFNLNLARYIDSTEPEDLQDIDAHLRGGIPNRDIDGLKNYWEVFPEVRAALFKKGDRPGYSQLRVLATEVNKTIFSHEKFTAFNTSATKLFESWSSQNSTRLKAFGKDGQPKALIQTIAEELLSTFEKTRLLDPYDIYQHLMDYWAETMQDDCYLIAADGWPKAAQPRLIVEDKAKKNKTKPDFILGKKKYTAELIPPSLVVARYFPKDQAAIDTFADRLAALTHQMEEMVEEHGGEGGLLEDARNDKDKLTNASVAARLKELGKTDSSTADERQALYAYLALAEQEADKIEVRSCLKVGACLK